MKMNRYVRAIVPLAILVALIGFRLIQKRAELRAELAQRQAMLKAAQTVSVAPVGVQDIVTTYEGVGSVDPPLNVQVSPQVTGIIRYLAVHEGDRISKGQVLVRIDPAQIDAQVRQAQAALDEAQWRLVQAQTTRVSNDVSVDSQLQEQRAAVTSAQSTYNQATQNYQSQVASAQATLTSQEAAVRSAQANQVNLQSQYKRQTLLYQKGYIAAQDEDTAKTAADAAQASLDAAVGQRDAARQQLAIVTVTGKVTIETAAEALKQARAALDFAVANLSQKPAYEQNLAALRATVAGAKENLRATVAQRSYTVLTAPLDGYVTGRFMDPGATATPGQPILAVQYFRQIWVTVAVPGDVAQHVAIGRTAEVTFGALGDRTFTGRIIQFNPSANLQSRQFSVRVLLDNADVTIKPGMFAHVVFDTTRLPHLIVVPREAVQRDEHGDYVMVADEGVAKRRAVTLGPASVSVIAISRGVRPGETVVTLSTIPLKDGQRVAVSKGQPTAAPATGGYGSTAGTGP
jgi:RND family efflux transporter MFP subunit